MPTPPAAGPAGPSDPLPPVAIKHALLAGAFGGLATPVLRAALSFTRQAEIEINVTVVYLLGLVLLAGLGAATVWVLNESERRKAFIIGLGLPATFSALLSQPPPKSGADTKSTSGLHSPIGLFVTSAYAAQSSVIAAIGELDRFSSTMEERTRQFRVAGVDSKIDVRFLDARGEPIVEFAALPARGYSIPNGAVKAEIQSSGGAKTVDLGKQPGSVTVANVALERKQKWGFLQAFGVPATTSETLDAKSVVKSPREVGKELWIKLPPAAESSVARINGSTGTTTAFVPVRGLKTEKSMDGFLLPGDSFTVLAREPSPTGEEWVKVKLNRLVEPTQKPN